MPRSLLAFAQPCMVMVSLPRSWQDLGKVSKELCMDLDKTRLRTLGNESSKNFPRTSLPTLTITVIGHAYFHRSLLHSNVAIEFKRSQLYAMRANAFFSNLGVFNNCNIKKRSTRAVSTRVKVFKGSFHKKQSFFSYELLLLLH